ADSTLSVDLQILLADGKSTSTLTYTARDSSGKPIPGMTLKTQAKGLQDFALSEWKDNGNGTYTQIVTAGKTSGALSLMPQFNGDDIAKTPALIAIVANTASRADSTIETDQDNYVAGKPIVVKVTLRDDNGNGVTGRKELLKQTVKVDNTKADAVSAWTEESEGIYKASYTAHLIGDKLTAQLTMPGWQTKHSDAFSIAGDKDTAKIAAMQITANNAVARRDHNTVAVTVRDVHQNLLQGQNVTFTVVNGAAVFADPNGGIVTTDKDGIASVNLASDQAVNSLIKAEINGSSQSVEVSFITGDISQLTSTIKTDDVSYTAGGKIKVSVTLMDEQKNLVKGMASLLAGSGVVEVSGTDKNETGNWSEESDGVYTTTRTAKIAGDRHYATLKLSTWSSAQQSDAYAIRESGAVLAYSSIVTDKTTYTAGGAIKVTVTLKDSFENLVGGQRDVINQAIQLPNTKAESIAWNEDQKGIYTATYTALLPGTGLKAQLQMSDWASALTSNDYSISGDAASAQIVAMQVTTGNPDVLANGSDRHTVNVRVEDQFGNVLPEQTVTFTVTKGAAVFANAGQSADIRTDAHGMAEVDLSSTVADASTVEAKVNQSSDSKTVNFVADVSTAQIADLVVIKDGSEADGATANTLRARVTDAFGNTLGGQTVSVLADNGATVAPTVTTQPDGTVEISVTSQTAGISAVTASINNSSQSRNVTFIADVSTAKIADLVVSQDNAVADGAMANTLQVKVTDANGNTLVGQTVSVMAGNGATVTPTVITGPDGTVEISVTSQTAGTSTVTASINSSSLSQNVTFVPGDASQLTSTVETNKSNYTVGETITITVTLRDAFDNLVIGAASQLAANGVLTVDGTDPSKTGSWVESGGVYTTTRMATIAGNDQHANLQLQSWSVGVTSDRYDIQSGSPAQATSTIATDKNAYTAGETITVAVTLKDAHGNLVEGGESLLSGDNVTVEGAVRSGEWSETAGVYTATWSAQMAGDSHHATLTLPEWGSTKQSESYSIHSGAPVQANSAIRTDKSAYIAGEPLTVTVTLRDEFGNPALGLTSEVIESYIDNFAVGGATPDSLQWVEQNNGEYTIVWTAWIAEENLVAGLKLKTWATEIKSSLYGIQPGAAAQTQSTIVTDKTKYIAGDSITVTVVLKDAQGNFITDGVAQLNEESVQVRNADSIQGNNWVYNGDGKYQRQYMAHFAEANLNAQLKMAGWSDANYSKNYTINRGEVSMFRSQLRIHEVLVVAGADIPVSVLLSDEFGNPVNDGLDLLTDDAVYLQNVEKKHWSSWTFVGDGRYERTYMAYKEGENLNSYLHINGWYVGGQPSYTILPFVEVESLSVNGAKFRAADGFPKTGFDGAKFTLILTHNMKNTDYNWTSGIQGIQVDSNGMVTLEFIINKEVTITGTPKSNKGNKVTYKFSLQKWFIPQGIIQESWSEMNSYCIGNGYILPSSTDIVGSSTSGAVPRKVGSLWGEYGNLTSYDGIFRAEHYWLDSGMIFYPGDGHLSIASRSSPLCMKTF
ncbi:hypothetical protein J4604_000849, partial [Escherichia coli]|nr:hypothetical protein [Escherichia coli]EHT6628633.1 Ig-like domain-containing protein [Escherichia coli]